MRLLSLYPCLQQRVGRSKPPWERRAPSEPSILSYSHQLPQATCFLNDGDHVGRDRSCRCFDELDDARATGEMEPSLKMGGNTPVEKSRGVTFQLILVRNDAGSYASLYLGYRLASGITRRGCRQVGARRPRVGAGDRQPWHHSGRQIDFAPA